MSSISNFMPIQSSGSSGDLSQTPPSTSSIGICDAITSNAAIKILGTGHRTRAESTFVIEGVSLSPSLVPSTLRKCPREKDLQALIEKKIGISKSPRSGDLSSLAAGRSPLRRSPAGSTDLTQLI
jgi:hypothetical protein